MNVHYFLGLFEGDGYQWTGTFGITNRNKEMLERASKILTQFGNVKWKKDEKGFYRVYVASRPAKRIFMKVMEETKKSLNSGNMAFYFAGKFDADGSRWKDRDRVKITYGINDEINFDLRLLMSVGIESKIRKYRNRNALDLEISSENARKFMHLVKPFSIKMSSWDDIVRAVKCGNENMRADSVKVSC